MPDGQECDGGGRVTTSGQPAESGRIGVVVIGRNEGQRLIDCLNSIGPALALTVYVDSGSSDGSVAAAERMGATVLSLDMSVPFTAARARNAGFERLSALDPNLSFVQFIDGDCQLRPDWIGKASLFLEQRADVALVCGRRRERFPERSVYNALCDREWDAPVGEILESGGDFLIRADAFRQVGGFSPALIAGEEPELCVRLREKGWKIWRVEEEMTWHDANITRIGQWWRRNVRAGHAFAEVSQLHRGSSFGIWQRSVARAVFWGGALPGIALVGSFVSPIALALLGLYPLQIARIACRADGDDATTKWVAAAFGMLGKFPELQGVVQFHLNRYLRRRQLIIEYK